MTQLLWNLLAPKDSVQVAFENGTSAGCVPFYPYIFMLRCGAFWSGTMWKTSGTCYAWNTGILLCKQVTHR